MPLMRPSGPPVHTHASNGTVTVADGTGGTRTVNNPDTPDVDETLYGVKAEEWGGILLSRFGDYNIPYHTHDSRGKVDVVTAHTSCSR